MIHDVYLGKNRDGHSLRIRRERCQKTETDDIIVEFVDGGSLTRDSTIYRQQNGIRINTHVFHNVLNMLEPLPPSE